MQNKRILAVLALCICACVAVAGCDKGPKRVQISGTISGAGEKVQTGMIQFIPVDGQGPTDGTAIKEDGSFTAEVTTGEKIVNAYGGKIVGEIEADPVMNPGKMSPKVEDFDANVFKEEVKINVTKKGETFNIEFSGDGPAK
ncbi:MAG: hypothetical protein HUK22_05465 [Thermoguttaceae bacterium]|nr:hypothetical protein [Thermoguttaceae bacterium]